MQQTEEKGWLAKQTGTMPAYEKGFFYLDSSEIKLYMRSVISLTNAITFQEIPLPPLTDYRLGSGALHVLYRRVHPCQDSFAPY